MSETWPKMVNFTSVIAHICAITSSKFVQWYVPSEFMIFAWWMYVQCYEANKPTVSNFWESNPVFCHWATTTKQPPALTILYMYCTSGAECLTYWVGVSQHPEWLLATGVFNFTTVHIEDCEGWWLSGCHSSVTEHWLHKLVTQGSITDDYRQPPSMLNIQHHLCSAYRGLWGLVVVWLS